MFMPFQIPGLWFRWLAAVISIAVGVFVVNGWYDRFQVTVPQAEPGKVSVSSVRVFSFDPGGSA